MILSNCDEYIKQGRFSMKSIIGVLSRFLYVIIGIILLSAFVGLFTTTGIHLEFSLFLDNVLHIVKSLIFPENLVVLGLSGREYSIFINFWDHYFYSLLIFISALCISIIIGIVITYFTILLPQKVNYILTQF